MKDQMRSYFSGEVTYDSKGQLVTEFYFNEKGILRYTKDRSVINPPSVLREIGSTKKGTEEVEALCGKKVFDFPKPSSLIGFFESLVLKDGDVVVDFFSGSGTTAHATMDRCALTNSRCHYILVQLPEDLDKSIRVAAENAKNTLENAIAFCDEIHKKHTLCETAKERIRRAGDKVMAEWKRREEEKAQNLPLDGEADATKRVPPDIGFRVFKLETSNFVDWNPNPEDLANDLRKAKDNVLTGRSKEDILYEVIVKSNLRLTDRIVEHKVGTNTIYAVREGELMVCIDDKIPLSVGDEMIRLKHEVYGNPANFRAVFLDNGLTDDSKGNIVQRLIGDGVDETCIRCV